MRAPPIPIDVGPPVIINVKDAYAHPSAPYVKAHAVLTEQLKLSKRSLTSLEGKLRRSDSTMRTKRSALVSLVRESSMLERRIRRNENPRLLHYFVPRRKEKVGRLKEELTEKHMLRKRCEDSLNSEERLASQLAKKKKDAIAIRRAMGDDHISHIERCRQQAFDAAVDCLFPRPKCQQELLAEISQHREFLLAERSLCTQVDVITKQMKSGLLLFEEALRYYEYGPHVKTAGVELHRERAELKLLEANSEIGAAFAAFPPEARLRAPVGAQIGQILNPRGSDDMDPACLLGASSDKPVTFDVEGQISGLRKCVAFIREQLQFIETVKQAIIKNVQSFKDKLMFLERSLQLERKRVFDRLTACLFDSESNSMAVAA